MGGVSSRKRSELHYEYMRDGKVLLIVPYQSKSDFYKTFVLTIWHICHIMKI